MSSQSSGLVEDSPELYRYYRANERMLATILGDAAATEPPAEPDLSSDT